MNENYVALASLFVILAFAIGWDNTHDFFGATAYSLGVLVIASGISFLKSLRK